MSAVSIRIRTVIAENSMMAVVIHNAPLVDAESGAVMILSERVGVVANHQWCRPQAVFSILKDVSDRTI